MSILLLTIGGSLGAIFRYLLGLAIMTRHTSSPSPFPMAMIIVNLIGAFGLGIFLGLHIGIITLGAYDDVVYLSIAIGFFGSFTTFSTFSVEAMQMFRNKKWKELIPYVLLSILGSILAFLIGFNLSLIYT